MEFSKLMTDLKYFWKDTVFICSNMSTVSLYFVYKSKLNNKQIHIDERMGERIKKCLNYNIKPLTNKLE